MTALSSSLHFEVMYRHIVKLHCRVASLIIRIKSDLDYSVDQWPNEAGICTINTCMFYCINSLVQ